MTETNNRFIHTLTHEAAHAVIALSLGQQITQVWLEPKGKSMAGGIWHSGIQDPSLDNARVALAGVVYEWVVCGSLKNDNSRQDVLDAWKSLKYDRTDFTPRERSRSERIDLFKQLFFEVTERVRRFEPVLLNLADEFAARLLTDDRLKRKKKRQYCNPNWNERFKRNNPTVKY